MSDNSNDLGAFLAGFVIGGLVGAATAIILAPQSGSETRAQISTKSNELAHAGSDQIHHYRETASTYTTDYKERAGATLGNATSRMQDQARIVLDKGKTDTDTAVSEDATQVNGQEEQVDNVDSSAGDTA